MGFQVEGMVKNVDFRASVRCTAYD